MLCSHEVKGYHTNSKEGRINRRIISGNLEFNHINQVSEFSFFKDKGLFPGVCAPEALAPQSTSQAVVLWEVTGAAHDEPLYTVGEGHRDPGTRGGARTAIRSAASRSRPRPVRLTPPSSPLFMMGLSVRPNRHEEALDTARPRRPGTNRPRVGPGDRHRPVRAGRVPRAT